MPVVTPSRASTEIVKAVPYGVSFFSVICRKPSSSQRSSVRQRQIRPRASLVMKLTASGVANCAAIVRSPSFSRSAASTTTTNLPSRMSSLASSMVAKALRSCTFIGSNRIPVQQPLDVFREDVGLEIDGVAGLEAAQRRHGERLGDQGDGEAGVVHRRDRQRNALYGDRPLLHDVAKELWVDVDPQRIEGAHRPHAVDVALDDVAAERIAGAYCGLDVHLVAERLHPSERLRDHVEGEPSVLGVDDRQADAVDCDRVPDCRLDAALDDEPPVLEGGDLSTLL